MASETSLDGHGASRRETVAQRGVVRASQSVECEPVSEIASVASSTPKLDATQLAQLSGFVCREKA